MFLAVLSCALMVWIIRAIILCHGSGRVQKIGTNCILRTHFGRTSDRDFEYSKEGFGNWCLQLRFLDYLDVDLILYIIDVKGCLEIAMALNIHDMDLEKLGKEQFQRVGRTTNLSLLFV